MSLSFVASAVANAANITIPASAAVGDLAVLFDYAFTVGTTPADAVPSGWTSLVTASKSDGFNDARMTCSYKVLAGGEPGSSVTGLNSDSENKVMLVFHPSIAITTVTPSTWVGQVTAGNPTAQSILASGQPTPLLALAAACIEGGTGAFSVESPAFSATVATADADMLAGYTIYNSSPADHSLDMADLGTNNGLSSGYIRVA